MGGRRGGSRLQGVILHRNRADLAQKALEEGLMEGGTERAADGDVLFQWDQYAPPEGPWTVVLNRQEAVRLASDEPLRHQLLELNGIPSVAEKSARWIRKYYIALFQYQVLGVYVFQKPLWQIRSSAVLRGVFVPRHKYTPEIRRAVRLAVSALYAVGLDFGGVVVGVPSSRKLQIMHIDATPRTTPFLLERYVRAFARYCRRLSEVDEPILGTDIEFLLVDREGQVVPASRFLPYRGWVGYDAYRDPANRRVHPIAELRPVPSRHPLQLYRNLYAAMKYAHKKLRHANVAWLAGNQPVAYLPIGGHLHFSRVPLHFLLVRVLDEYLALPFRILEDPRGVSRRRLYGMLGDVRSKPHGFEYRTLSSFIYTPKITLATFALAKFLVQHHWKLPVGTFLQPEMVRAYYFGNGAELYQAAEAKMAFLESLPEFEEVRTHVQPFFQQVRAGTPVDEKQDIRQAWRFIRSH